MDEKELTEKCRQPSPIQVPLPIKSFGDPFRQLYIKLGEKNPKPHNLHGHFASFHNCLLMCRATWKDFIHVLDEQFMKGMRYEVHGKQDISNQYDYVMDSYFLTLSRYYSLIMLLKITTDRSLSFLQYAFKGNSLNVKSLNDHRKQILKANDLEIPEGYKELLENNLAWFDQLKFVRDKLIVHYNTPLYPMLSFNREGSIIFSLENKEAKIEPWYLPNPLIFAEAFEDYMSQVETIFYQHFESINFEIA